MTNAPILPHFVTPFSLGSTGKPKVAEQDSTDDVRSCVLNILSCPLGGHLGDSAFGTPSILFQTIPIDPTPLMNAVQEYEPRAQNLLADDIGNIAAEALGIVSLEITADTNSES